MQILFADQLGSHFNLEGESQVILEAPGQFRKRKYHRQKAHLILSGIRHRAALGAELIQVTSLRDFQPPKSSIVVNPSSRPMRDLVASWGIRAVPARGFVASEEEFKHWVSAKRGRLILEDFYRWQRQRTGILMNQTSESNLAPEPVGGRWNFDAENRLSPPKSDRLPIESPWWPLQDEIDERVRWDLDRLESEGVEFLGTDGERRFAVTEQEAVAATEHFLRHRLQTFGPFEDAMMHSDWAMSHSLLSVPLNLGVLDPSWLAEKVAGAVTDENLASVEGFIRQVIGWRDFVWHLYWLFGEDYQSSNSLSATRPLPDAWANLQPDQVEANCTKHALRQLRDFGWLHHIQRLMVLANEAAQRGYRPDYANDWFIDAFVDGTPWVMPANVIGMGLFADGGRMSTKPYVSGGAYISRMSNYCKGCPFNPKVRVGPDACPFTAGYWNFLAEHETVFRSNHRMFQPMAGLRKLSDLEELRAQEAVRFRF